MVHKLLVPSLTPTERTRAHFFLLRRSTIIQLNGFAKMLHFCLTFAKDHAASPPRRRREDQHGLSWGLRECRLNDLTHMWRCVVAHDMTWLLSLHNGPCTSHLLTTFEVRPLLKAQDHYSCQDKDDQLSHKSQSKSSVKDGGPGGRTGRTYRT